MAYGKIISVLAALAISLPGCASIGEDRSDAAKTAEKKKPAKGKVSIKLDPAGLLVIGPKPGKTSLVPFGSSQLLATDTAYRALEKRPDKGSNDECGAGPMEFEDFGALSLNFQNQKFVGWFLDGHDGSDLKTSDGLHIGIMAASTIITQNYQPYPESTLGREFHARAIGDGGGISGLIDGTAKDSRVTVLWAGTNCIFR